MTEQSNEPEFVPDEEPLAIPEDDNTNEEATAIELSRATVQLMINVDDVSTLDEAVSVAALNFGRYGLDAFYMLVTDPDTGRQWQVIEGQASGTEDDDSDDGDEPTE